ncbi:MAG: hypothetical protein WBN63_07890 [Eudoraea sp.]|uniref:hypothetical protein n=1 Tax=Eudoraea sp. TaxID=1979955 RepID=UPI003C78608C
MENHNIILFVDTANITKENIEERCSFHQGKSKERPGDHSTSVDEGETITWLGLSTSNANDVVNITKIEYKGGADLFGRPKLNGDGGYPETVIGTIKNAPKGEETYTITFTVYEGNNGGKRNGKFTLDPKLQPKN